MKIAILYENTHFIAINKPAGLIVEQNPWEHSVEAEVMTYLQKTKKKPFLGIVHRLDRVTSGVLILAKKKSALKHLNQQFAERKVRKIYWAIVPNKPPKPQGKLIHYLRKNQQEKRAEILEQKAKNAQEVRLNYRIKKKIKQGFLLEIQPLTGKFHQIRAQLAHIGCPILGDVKYHGEAGTSELKIGLHAYQLQFVEPLSEEVLTVTASIYL